MRDQEGRGYLELLGASQDAFHGELDEALERCATELALAETPLDISPYVNASAFSVRRDFSLHRAYMLFASRPDGPAAVTRSSSPSSPLTWTIAARIARMTEDPPRGTSAKRYPGSQPVVPGGWGCHGASLLPSDGGHR